MTDEEKKARDFQMGKTDKSPEGKSLAELRAQHEKDVAEYDAQREKAKNAAGKKTDAAAAEPKPEPAPVTPAKGK